MPNEKVIELDVETAKIVREKAEKEGTTPKEAVRRIIQERLNKLAESSKIVDCKHCPKSKNAEKPYVKMTKVALTPLAQKIASELYKECGLDASCFLCIAIENFAKLPKSQQLELLKNKK